MKLTIENFAKIKKADVVVDGITVIAGDNNTGKSTIGKVLFALFNVLSNIEQKVLNERIAAIDRGNQTIIRDHINSRDFVANRNLWLLSRQITRKLREEMDEELQISEDSIDYIVENVIIQGKSKDLDENRLIQIKDEICRNIIEILNLPKDIILLEAISRYFDKVFSSQINYLGDNVTEANLCLDIKDKSLKLSFLNNHCNSFQDDVHIIHKAIYVDNPFIVDQLTYYNDLSAMDMQLRDLLVSKEQEGVLEGIIETVLAKEKLSDIYDSLQSVIPGEIIIGQDDEFYLKDSNYSEPIAFQNLSTGLKSFIILKMLIEKNAIEKKDVIILDEPEVYLHPQWQIIYAELIVLLQKRFDLSVIVTTHSPYFVDAINLYSCKHNTDNKVNYYISENVGNAVGFKCVNDSIEDIYSKMASPIQLLDDLRYELNNDGR